MKFLGKSAQYLVLFTSLTLLLSCAGAPIRKITEEEGRVGIAAGPPKGFSISQTLTSITEVRWTLSRGDREETRKKVVGLKILAFYKVVDRKEDVATISVNLKNIKILRGNTFITAPFTQFSPPNPVEMEVNYKSGNIRFPNLAESYGEWATGLKGTPVWDVMGGAFNVEAFVSQLEDLISTPVAEFAGKRLALGEENTEEKVFHLPFLGPRLSLGPVDVVRKFSVKGVLSTAGTNLALIEGKLFSEKLSMDADTLEDRLAIFGAKLPEQFETRGELGGRFRARVDTASGWSIQDSRKIHSITIVEFKDGYFKEEIFGRKNVYETE